MNYHNRTFRPTFNSKNGEVSNDMVFRYQQQGHILWCDYSGGSILRGHLLGTVSEGGIIHMRYHQINAAGEIRTGICTSTPEILENGKIRLHESWQWTSGDGSAGQSILEEL